MFVSASAAHRLWGRALSSVIITRSRRRRYVMRSVVVAFLPGSDCGCMRNEYGLLFDRNGESSSIVKYTPFRSNFLLLNCSCKYFNLAVLTLPKDAHHSGPHGTQPKLPQSPHLFCSFSWTVLWPCLPFFLPSAFSAQGLPRLRLQRCSFA